MDDKQKIKTIKDINKFVNERKSKRPTVVNNDEREKEIKFALGVVKKMREKKNQSLSLKDLKDIIENSKIDSHLINTNKIFEVDLTKKNGQYDDKSLKEDFTEYFKCITGVDKKLFYVFVKLTPDNIPLVVGKTSFTFDKQLAKPKMKFYESDLFSPYSLMGGIAQEIILRSPLIEDGLSDIRVTDDKGNEISVSDFLETIDKNLKSFVKKAYIIPVDIEKAQDAKTLETFIGEILKDAGKPVIHNKGHI